MLKGVIFDLDGVLVDSHPIHMRAWRRLFQAIGKSVAERDMQFILEGQKRDDILSHFLGDLTEEQKRWYGSQKEILFREEARAIDTIPGVRRFLDELASESIAMGVASCGSRSRVNHLLNLLELQRFFKVVMTGDDVELGKPDPGIFKKAAIDLETDRAELLVFEDSVSGVEAAKAAQMKCVGITPPDRAGALLEAGVDYVLPDFRQASLSQIRQLFA